MPSPPRRRQLSALDAARTNWNGGSAPKRAKDAAPMGPFCVALLWRVTVASSASRRLSLVTARLLPGELFVEHRA